MQSMDSLNKNIVKPFFEMSFPTTEEVFNWLVMLLFRQAQEGYQREGRESATSEGVPPLDL